MTDATDILYAYDLLGRLATVTAVKLDGQTLLTPLVTTYHYDADNNLTETDLPNTTVETRQYDALDRLVFLQNTGPGGSVISSYHYTLGPDGTRWAVAENTGRYVAYTYDADNRLTGEVYDHTLQGQHVRDIAWTYTYDLAGNRVAQTGQTPADSGPVTLNYTYDANDRLVSASGEVPSADPTSSSITFINATYAYDNNGNTLTVSGTRVDQATYTYDAAGRMATATVTDHTTDVTHQSSYAYDDAGNRVSQTVDGQTTTYLNDPNQAYDQVLEEYAPGGVLAATYVQGYDLLFQDRTAAGGGAGLSFYAKDGLGSTRALTNVAGAVTDTYTYDAFGNLTASTGTTTNEFLYAGYQADAATGLDYLRARYLDTAAGRFTSRDSNEGMASNPATLNHYAYASADPVSRIDPSGHGDFSLASVSVSVGIGAAISGLDAAIAGKSGREIVQSAVIGGVIGAFGPALGSLKYWRAVAGGTSVALGIVGAYEAYLDGKFGLAAFRGVTSFASLTLIVVSAAQSGALQPLLPAGRVQVGRLAARLKIRSLQSGLREPDNVDIYKAAMLENDFRFDSPEGQIAGLRTPDGTYYVDTGNHRVEAALEILAQTGDDAPLNSLLKFGAWTDRPIVPSSYRWSSLAESLNPVPWLIFPAWGAIQDIFRE